MIFVFSFVFRCRESSDPEKKLVEAQLSEITVPVLVGVLLS